VNSEAKLAVETLGRFIDERYAPWAREHVGDNAAAQLKVDLADWLSEPLATLSAWRIESWRRDQLDALAQPLIVSRQLLALHSCLSKAVEWLLIERNPLQDVSLEAETDYFIELFAGGVGHGYLREGWAQLGVNCTWTLGERAVLEFPPVSGAADYVLKMRIDSTCMGSPQRLLVDVNETTVGILLCRGPASYEFFVPACALIPQNRIDVVLKTPDARRPMDHGESTDNRFLGFRVAKIELRPMTKSRQEKQLQPPAADDLPRVLEQRAALQEIVSLGFNCEFGFAQRYVGAEPMSLFRWSFVPLDKLIEGLEKRFAGLNARDALDVQVTPEGEFVVESKVYGYRHHTFVFASKGGVLERVLRNEYLRVGLLCKTLLEELREHKKLFVYHDAGASKLEDIRRLLRALNVYGNNTLLWIVGAPETAQIGETRQLEPGLIQGYVSGFQEGPITPLSPHRPSWVQVACRAHQIWSRTKEPQEQFRLEKQLQHIHKP
jgi:hypothetical protein